MNIYVVTDSSSYEKRAELIRDFYKKKGHEATLIVPDFNHMTKRRLSDGEKKSDRIYIDTGEYKKNISLKRLYYHHAFAKKAYKLLRGMLDADIEESAAGLYVLIPGNSLLAMGARLKRETGCRLIADIIDLWPESLPISGIGHTLPVRMWKSLRDKSLSQTDYIITECALYKEILGLDDKKTSVIYWPKQEKIELIKKGKAAEYTDGRTEAGASEGHEITKAAANDTTELSLKDKKTDAGIEKTLENSSKEISIAYIGSINNIIDIPVIISVLKAVNKRRHVRLSVIGDGERKDAFLRELEEAGISFIYHGAVYDERKKQGLLQENEWGLNIMKPTVRVGLTMKSIDYLANGLKLINSIDGDTRELVDKYGLGVNISEYAAKKTDGSDYSDNWEAAAERIASYNGADRDKIHEFFMENFSVEAMHRRMREINL